MADIIGQETWSADGKSYVIKVTEPGATVTENAISIISGVHLRQGAPNYDPIHPVLESQIEFTIRDTSKLFRTALAGKEIGDIVLEFTEDGATLFKGYVIPDYQRALSWLDNPDYKVSAFDGINGLKGFTWDITGEKDLRELLHECADKIGLELTLNSIFETKHNGADSSTDPIDALRNRAEHFLSEGSTYYDMLVLLCEFFGCQFFQSGGEWYFMERIERDGGTMTNYPTNSSGAAQTDATVNYNFNITNADLHRDVTFFDYHPATARFQSSFVYPEYLLKNNDWSEGVKYWDNNGSYTYPGTNLDIQIDDNNGYLTQTVGTTLLDSDTLFDKIYFGFSVRINIDATATGVHDFEYCEIQAIDDDGTINYLNNSSAWTSSQTYIEKTSVDFGANAGSSFSFNATITTAKIPFTPARIVFTLTFEKDATGNLAHITSVEFGEITVLHLKPAQEDDIVRPEQFSTTDTSGNLGDNLEQEYTVGDVAEKYNGIGVFEYYDGSDWVPTSDWDGSGQDVHELRVANYKAQLGSRQELYEFSHRYGEVPELYNNLIYAVSGITGNVYLPVFIDRMYERNAKPYAKSAAVQKLGSTTEVLFLTDIWFTAYDPSSTAAPQNAMYKYDIPDDTTTVPWVTDVTPWASNNIHTGDTGSSDFMSKISVDRAAEYVFTYGHAGREIQRHDLDGNNEHTPSPSLTCWGLALKRTAQQVIVYDLTTFEEYNYDLDTSVRTVFTKTGSSAGAPCVDQSEAYMFCVHLGVSSVDYITRIDLDTLSSSNVTTITSLGVSNADSSSGAVDEAAGYVFFNLAVSGQFDIHRIDYPGGGSLTTIHTNVASTVTLDRLNQKLIYGDLDGNIKRSDYDGTNIETILSMTSNIEIESVCVGMT